MPKLPNQPSSPMVRGKTKSRQQHNRKSGTDRPAPSSEPEVRQGRKIPAGLQTVKPGIGDSSASGSMFSRLMKKSRDMVQGKNEPSDKSAQRAAKASEKQAETQFFGIQAQGGCFAFILDISLSMEGARLAYCKRELIQALNSLPEHASFGVFLYADTVYTPAGQNNWILAKGSAVANVVNWIAGIGVKPYTRPGPAFERAFSYPTAPNVIFFLTDGELFNFTAKDCACITGARSSISKMVSGLFTNRESRPVPLIHTIALGQEAITGVLQQIAHDHSGTCRVIAQEQ